MPKSKKKSDVQINSDSNPSYIPGVQRQEGESAAEYARRGWEESAGGRLKVAAQESKDRRYASDKSYKGTKYSSDASERSSRYGADQSYAGTRYASDAGERNSERSLEGSKYGADRSYAGTVYSSDASERSNKYSSDNSLEGTKYSSDRSLEGSKYGADRSLEGTKYGADSSERSSKYSADVSERNNRRDAGNTFLSNYATLASQPKNYFAAQGMLHNGIQNGYGSFVDDARDSTNQNQRGFVSYQGDFPGNKAQSMFAQGGDDDAPYYGPNRPQVGRAFEQTPDGLRYIYRPSQLGSTMRMEDLGGRNDLNPEEARPIPRGGRIIIVNPEVGASVSMPQNGVIEDEYGPRSVQTYHRYSDEDAPRVYRDDLPSRYGAGYDQGGDDDAPVSGYPERYIRSPYGGDGGKIIIVHPEASRDGISMPQHGVIEDQYGPIEIRSPSSFRFQPAEYVRPFEFQSRYGDGYDQGGDFGGGGNDTGSPPVDQSNPWNPQVQAMQTAPSIYRQQSVAAPSSFAALPAPSQQQGQGYPDMSSRRPSSGRYQAMSSGYGGGSNYGSKPQAYRSSGGGQYHTMSASSNGGSDSGYDWSRRSQYRTSDYDQGGSDTQYSGQWQGNGGGADGSSSSNISSGKTDWASQDTWDQDQKQLAKMDDAFRPGVGKWKAGYWEGLDDDAKDLWRSYWANRGISAKQAEHDYASSRTGNADYFGTGRIA